MKKKRISSFKSGIVGAVVGFASAVLCLFLLLRAGSLPIWPSTSEAGYTDTGRAALAIVRKNEKSGLKSLTGLTRVQINELCGTPVIIGHEDRDNEWVYFDKNDRCLFCLDFGEHDKCMYVVHALSDGEPHPGNFAGCESKYLPGVFGR